MNEQNSTAEQPADQPDDEHRNQAPPPREQPPQDPRRRLRELLAVPERDRSDEQWDEIISLEIQLAPENRVSSAPPQGARHSDPGRGNAQARRQRPGGPGNKPPRRFSKKSKRRPGAPVKT